MFPYQPHVCTRSYFRPSHCECRDSLSKDTVCLCELSSVSCLVVTVPTAVREVAGCLQPISCLCTEILYVCMCAHSLTVPGCRCYSEITSCWPSCCVCIHRLQPFPVHREEEAKGNRMSIPWQDGSERAGKQGRKGADPRNMEHGHTILGLVCLILYLQMI